MQHTEEYWMKALHRSAAALMKVYKIPLGIIYKNKKYPSVYGSASLKEKLSNVVDRTSWKACIESDSDELSRIVVPPNYDPVNAYAEALATEALPKLSKPLQYLNFEEIREYVGKI